MCSVGPVLMQCLFIIHWRQISVHYAAVSGLTYTSQSSVVRLLRSRLTTDKLSSLSSHTQTHSDMTHSHLQLLQLNYCKHTAPPHQNNLPDSRIQMLYDHSVYTWQQNVSDSSTPCTEAGVMISEVIKSLS